MTLPKDINQLMREADVRYGPMLTRDENRQKAEANRLVSIEGSVEEAEKIYKNFFL